MKKIIGLLLSLCLTLTTSMGGAVMAYSEMENEAISVLTSLDIVNGYEDGSVKPEQSITRAEAATLIVRAINEAVDGTTVSQFADVNADAKWATGYVNIGVAYGFINGYDADTFGPNDNVTYAQMCKMLACVIGYGEYAAANGGWPMGYCNIAAQTGITNKVIAAPDTVLTRGQVFQMIYNALTVPMLGVYEFSALGNTYTQLDGKNNRDFKTLLSDKYDGYVATVCITETPVSSSLDNDKVKFDVVKADWWPEEGRPVTTASPIAPVTTYFDNVDVNSNHLQTGKAVFVTDDNDELVMVYFAVNGRTETKELDANDYVKQSELSAANKFAASGKIKFDNNYYRVANDAMVYVNGVEYDTIDTVDLDTIIGKAQGTVKLVKDSESNEYNTIFVNYYQVAKVTSVDVDEDEVVISLTNTKAVLVEDTTEVDEIIITNDAVEDGDTVVTVIKNGKEADISDLSRGDIVAYAIDFDQATLTLEDPKFITIYATDATATGMVMAIDDETQEYTIDDTVYTLLDGVTLEIQDSVELTLDPFGRVYAKEVNGMSDKYAVLLKANDIEDTVTLLLPDGKVVTYNNNATIPSDIDIVDSGLEDRVITYRLKSSTKTVTSIAKQRATLETDLEYKSRTGKLNNYTILDTTDVIDATEVDLTNPSEIRKAGNYASFDVDNFVNNTVYNGIVIKTNTYVNFVIITKIGTVLSDESRFALALTNPKPYYSEEYNTCWMSEVLYNGEKIELLFENEDEVSEGQSFFFKTNSEGFSEVVGFVGTIDEEEWSFDITDKRASIIYATDVVIVEVDDNSITFATNTTTIDTNKDLIDDATGVINYAVADDYVSYVYDVNADYSSYKNKVRVKTPKASNLDKFEGEGDSEGVYTNIEDRYVVKADVLIVDGDIVAIYSEVK